MGRLKVVDAPQRGRRRPYDPTKATEKSAKGAGTRSKTIKKPRTFLTKDEQALLAVEYLELPKRKQGSAARSKALVKLCKKYDVNTFYPAEMLRKLKQEKLLPTRDGVGGAPEKITAEQQEVLKATLVEHAYDLTYRQLETLTGIPATSIWRFVKETDGWKEVRKGTRPFLTPAHVAGRHYWAEHHQTETWSMRIDLDEKWFYAYSAAGTLKLPPGHTKPKTPIKSKRYIPKVMMLAGIGKPIPRLKFDGKLGMWPIGELRAAKRSDKRTGLKVGDMLFDASNLDGKLWVDLLMKKVIPAVRKKLKGAGLIKLQVDNAPGHRTSVANSPALQKLLDKGNPKIELVEQMPQSPCTNLCDLGFFRSIDSRLPKLRSFQMPTFIKQIEEAFEEYPEEKLDALCAMKTRVCVAIVENWGENDFVLPHRKKNA